MIAPFRLAPLLCAAVLSSACVAALAQRAVDDVDWRELETPAPPALRTDGLLKFDVSVSSESPTAHREAETAKAHRG